MFQVIHAHMTSPHNDRCSQAAAFRPQSRNGSQDAEAATANRIGAPVASITASSHQQNPPPGSVDWAGIDRYLDGASTPTGTDSPDLHSRHSQSTPTQQQLQLDAAADRQTPAKVHSISVSRSANLATVSSLGAGLESPQTAESPKLPSKTAQLYQKLLQGSLAGASSSSSPKAASPSRQHRTSQSNGDSVAGSPIARSSTLGKSMPLAAGKTTAYLLLVACLVAWRTEQLMRIPLAVVTDIL